MLDLRIKNHNRSLYCVLVIDLCGSLTFAGPLGPKELSHCLQLDSDLFSASWTKEQWDKELTDIMRPCVGIWQRGQLLAIACGWLVIDELHITNVTVAKNIRRQGLGYQVTSILLDYGRSRGARHATLEVNSINTAALKLYNKLGFSDVGKRSCYYGNNDARVQWLKL